MQAPFYQTISRKENLLSLTGFSKGNGLTHWYDGLMRMGRWCEENISSLPVPRLCKRDIMTLQDAYALFGHVFLTSLRNLLFIIACNDCF